MSTIITEEGHRLIEYILYGEEPLKWFELIFRPGFIRLMLLIWSPVILILIILYVIHKIEKRNTVEEINSVEDMVV